MQKKICRYLFFFFVVIAFLSCSDSKVIPKKKLSRIYAELFLADQWINSNYKAARTADTTYVYEAIFEKYGYDSTDYRASVEHYMEDPDRFARILRNSATILEERIDELKAEQRLVLSRKPATLITFDFDRVMLLKPHILPDLLPKDSVDLYKDSSDFIIFDPFYKLKDKFLNTPVIPEDFIEAADTLASTDSIQVADSLTVTDSLAVNDSLSVTDSPVLSEDSLKIIENEKDSSKISIQRVGSESD